MAETISDKIIRWQENSPSGPNFNDIYSYIIFRNDRSYWEYHPTIGPVGKFEKRLLDWLNNFTDDKSQQELLQFVPNIFFIGSEEFISLYRLAINENITQWIIDLYNIDIFLPDATAQIENAFKKTWFCPVTDSMHIADFCHVNIIHGNKYRPDWRSLAKFGSGERIVEYMQENNLENIILLEDFVGTGSQILGQDEALQHVGAVPYASSLSNAPNILIVPLVICTKGYHDIYQLLKSNTQYNKVAISPVLILPDSIFINEDTKTYYPKEYDLIMRASAQIAPGDFKYGPFGYKNTGSPVVMYTNCPDNTISLIYQNVSGWKPLFPRSSRM